MPKPDKQDNFKPAKTKKAPVREEGQRLENRVIRYDQASAPRSTEVPKLNRYGRFPGFRVILLAAPSRKKSSGIMRRSSPFTVAGQRRISTFFPFNHAIAAQHQIDFVKQLWLCLYQTAVVKVKRKSIYDTQKNSC
jgi:hypothetical protein